MVKPIVKKQKVKGVKALSVQFGKTDETIYLFDDRYNLGEEVAENTFVNLCYEVCSSLRTNFRFVYVATQSLPKEAIEAVYQQETTRGVLFVDSAPFKRLELSMKEYFSYVREDANGIPMCLTTPFSKWAGSEGFSKGESGKNLIGFNLKHLTWVCQGNNGYEDYSHLFENFPIRMIQSRKKFKQFMQRMLKQSVICVDVEGKGLARITNTLYTVQFGVWEGERIVTYVLPWEHRDHVWSKEDFRFIKKYLKKLFLDETKEIVYHFAQYDIGQLCHELGLDVHPAKVYDTVAGVFAEDENWKFVDKLYRSSEFEKGYKPYALECLEYRHNLFRPSDILEKDDRTNMSRFSLVEIATYGAYDVVSPLIIRQQQLERCTSRWIGYKTVKQYKRLVWYQLGVMQKTFALLMNTGIHIDIENAKKLTQKGSVFEETLDKIRDEILATKAGQKANKLILEKQGVQPSGGIFSSQQAVAFSMTKPAHLRTLFFDVLKLEPVSRGKSGEPSTDKAFQNKYKDNKVVKLFGHFNKAKTLKSNFADSIVKKLVHDDDFKYDGRLRALFGFVKVVTGRISVNRPNSQNIPTRSDNDFEIHKSLVKGIKANFSVREGRLMIGSDFSAHEVRMSGVISEDPGIRQAFLTANEAIRKYRLAPEKFLAKAAEILAREGDIHIINVKFFFKQTVDKSHPLRYKIKAVVFGVLYGKMAKSLAKELGIEVEEAQSLIDVMFDRWDCLKTWIDNVQATGKAEFMIDYPNHRIRHLWAYLHDDIWVHHAMDRRAVNSVIQGFSSDIGVVAVDCYKMWVYQNITRNGYLFDAEHTNIVHDAQYSDVLYEHAPLALYLTEHSMSTLPMDYYRKKFGYTISIPLSYGLEFGKNWASLNEWDFRSEKLLDMLRDEGKRMEKPHDPVIKDMKWLLKVRKQELEKNPYRILIRGNNVSTMFEKLNMFKEQEREAA